ncbi:hypothetical protein JB92DRAFT_2539000, partial [Gautieria morchelliformis]
DFQDDFGCMDVSVTLVSRDKTRFRVSACVLRAASCVFNTILSLPQPKASPRDPVIDNLDEDAATIEGLLRMITGREIPSLDRLESIEALALAAEKWEMPGPLSIIRMLLLRDKSFAVNSPIRLYWLGCRLRLPDLSNLASSYSCTSDIYYNPDLEPVLKALGAEDLLRLIKFHRQRRDCMR